jgi:hypothetical protein
MNTKQQNRRLDLPDGGYVIITFTDEGIVYDLYDHNDELVTEYGYDFYFDVIPSESAT